MEGPARGLMSEPLGGPPAGLCLLSGVLAQVRAVRALPTCGQSSLAVPAKARALSAAAAPTERRLSPLSGQPTRFQIHESPSVPTESRYG